MKRPPDKPRRPVKPEDSLEYVEGWARELIAAIGKHEARRILANYRVLAEDPKVTKHGRKTASERAEVLKRIL